MGKFSETLKEDIAKKFWFAQRELSGKFSYGKFETGFKTLIENTFNEMMRTKKEIIDNQIEVFNRIIEQKFSEQISLESYEKLEENKKDYINGIEEVYLRFSKKSGKKFDIISEYLSNIKDYFNLTKINIKDSLKKKSWEIIKEEIKAEISKYIIGLSLSIEKLIDEINEEIINNSKIKERDLWDKYISLNINNFKEYFTYKVSKEGIKLSEEIKNELNKCFEDTKRLILIKKGFKEWIESLLSSEDYLNNFIDVLNKTLNKKYNYTLRLITKHFGDYKNKLTRLIQQKVESIGLAFDNLKPEELKRLKQECSPKIEEIKKALIKDVII